ncbi:hypothetical protein INT43_006697 [Umbelopsis isabellina]|uniref:SH3 domain-containing protein n=1 Tax=Mortierella isabellina TaxID=91625 RepID=A0A8H7PZN9_MORIS|nr:hypothetical protein INT43_006697 [Umbelopsis isabellina]
MNEKENALANHILSNIQQNLSILRDQKYITSQAHDQILGILPSNLSVQAAEQGYPPRKSPGNIPSPNPRPNSSLWSVPQPPPRRTPGAEVNDLKKEFPVPKPLVPTAGNYNYNPEKAAPPAMPAPEKEPEVVPPAYSVASAEALYDYHGQDKEDLSFRKGDIIEVTEFVNDDWWRGRVHGQTGIFPQNHVVKIETQNKTNRAQPPPPPPPPPPGASPFGAPAPLANQYSGASTSSLPYNYPPPPAMYQPPPASGNYMPPPPGQAVYAPAGQPEVAGEDSKGKRFAKKFGSQVASGAAWGVGMSGKQHI